MHFHIISLFPEFFDSPLRVGLFGRAQSAGLVSYSLHNPRIYATDTHHTVDDRPYGGGPGMVMLLEPLVRTLRAISAQTDQTGRAGRILVMAPSGRPFTQDYARELSHETHITLVCGRYEGIDARLSDIVPVEYVSMGEAVCSGGEAPALMLMEAVARLVPGFMGKEDSGTEESFAAGLLEYPHYTRPEIFEGHSVPHILRGGDHARIAAWRREQSLQTTLTTRPDMLASAPLTGEDTRILATVERKRLGQQCFIALAHYPVIIEGKNSGASSLTNLDIHDIARISCTYALGGVYITTPLEDQRTVLEDILRHWLGPARTRHADRAKALACVQGVPLIEDAVAHIRERTGQNPRLIGTTAQWPGKKYGKGRSKKQAGPCMTITQVRNWLENGPVLLLFGTGHGLAPEVLASCDGVLRPLRCLDDYNHLSVRAAVAITVDRILGDVF